MRLIFNHATWCS